MYIYLSVDLKLEETREAIAFAYCFVKKMKKDAISSCLNNINPV